MTDVAGYRRAPRPLAIAVGSLQSRLAPATTLARIQACWAVAVGEQVASEAHPRAEHAGVLSVSCSSSVWAAELQMMGPQLVVQLNEALGETAVTAVRCRAR